jgi:hypothetical protein
MLADLLVVEEKEEVVAMKCLKKRMEAGVIWLWLKRSGKLLQ